MSVNKFGLSEIKSKSEVSKQYIDSKFTTLVKHQQAKVNKSGDTMSGELNMGNNKITDLSDPISDNDATNKKFVDSKVIKKVLIQNYILIHCLTQSLTEM